ncbi:unnamed protein product, partial [Cylicostephanus goldi]
MSTAPLIVLGCTMMRKCHLNTCPVGIATQATLLEFGTILKNVHHMFPNISTKSGMIKQTIEPGELEKEILKSLPKVFAEPGCHLEIKDKTITNIDRAFCARISYEISKRYGEEGLSGKRSIKINLKGSAGQSLCAFLAKGVTVELEGDANDY